MIDACKRFAHAPVMSEDHSPPNIAEFGKWLGYHLTKDWRLMLKAPIAFGSVVLFAVGLAWILTWKVVVPEKNEQLSTKQSQIDFQIKKLDATDKENDHLRNELASYQASHDERALPLKRRALILSDQVKDYVTRIDAARAKKDMVELGALENEWSSRFESRVDVATRQLDAYGQHSDKLEGINSAPSIFDSRFSTNIFLYATEIKKMADNLPDTP